jgi:hypothetical protein
MAYVMIRKSNDPPDHPKIFLNNLDIPNYISKANGTHSAMYNSVKNYADTYLESARSCDGTQSENLESVCGEAAKLLLACSFCWIISGNTDYYDRALDDLLEYADSEAWGNRDHGHHLMLMAYAIAYDWLYNDLSETNRTIIKNALILRTEESYQASLGNEGVSGDNWWWKEFSQNHFTNNNASLGIASLVLENETNDASTWLNHVVTQYQKDKSILNGIAEGSWHESIYYQGYKFQRSLIFYHNYEILKGVNLIPEIFFENHIDWKLYNYLPSVSKWVSTFADIYTNAWFAFSPYGTLRYLASRYNNGYAEWLAQQLIAVSGSRNIYYATDDIFEFFYYDNTIAPVTPSSSNHSLNKTFNDVGIVIWRTGWGANDIVFALKSGVYGGDYIKTTYLARSNPYNGGITYDPHTAHDHPDTGTFWIYKGSLDLVAEKERYQVWETGNHNTILVDGAEQYRSRWANEIYADTGGLLETVCTLQNFNYLKADCTDAYRNRNTGSSYYPPSTWMITEFTRHVIFVKPNYFIMIDNLTANETHQYDWIYHVSEAEGAITVESTWIKGDCDENNILGINVLAPSSFHNTTGDSDGKPYIRIHPETNVDDVRFITVLYPTTSSAWESKPAMSVLANTSDGAGVRISLDGTQDFLINYGSESQIIAGDYTLTGESAGIIKNGSSTMTSFYVVESTLLVDDVTNILQSSSSISVEGVFSGASLALYSDDTLTGIIIYAPDTNTGNITLNGVSITATKNGNYITITG